MLITITSWKSWILTNGILIQLIMVEKLCFMVLNNIIIIH